MTNQPDTLAAILDGLLDAINDCPDPTSGVWERFGPVVGYTKELRQFLATEAGAARFDDFPRLLAGIRARRTGPGHGAGARIHRRSPAFRRGDP